MKVLLWGGLVVLALGILGLFIPVPQNQTHPVDFGGMKVGVQTQDNEKISPWASAALIVGGAGMMIAGKPRGKP